jgi:16S rRNA G527 N7-methylase RsmG
LIERTQKKAAALTRLLYGLELEADIIAGTFEETKFTDKFGLITMRLVKLTKPILKHVIAALKSEGKFVYYGSPTFDCDWLKAVSYSYSGANADSGKTFTILQRI